ncbi:hypothetical protein F8388_020338 [Cannabis sativa]|uniref:Reverse transcriptase zinc-binding domain-containing protein n=1 Tax=Cannabis sativa TaxID=3483 RepID=A0A7J6HGT5_CANSA|nr:hypothetical protein F8388_020338 [Cannabis sativa]
MLRLKHELKVFCKENIGDVVMEYMSAKDNFCLKKPKVQYSRGIWDNLLLPKHRFVYWQIINTQLLTRDFLSKFLPLQSTLCLLCDSEEESHEHVFYRCIFTKQVQQEVNSWLGNYSWLSSNNDLSYRIGSPLLVLVAAGLVAAVCLLLACA